MKLRDKISILFSMPARMPAEHPLVQTLDLKTQMTNTVNLKIDGKIIPVVISINKDTIEINTPMNIVINSQLFAVNTQFGVHLNPQTNDVEELQRTFINAQKVIE